MTYRRAIHFQTATFLLLVFAVVAGSVLLHRQDVKIQSQRADSIRMTCEQTNERNLNTKWVVRQRVKLALGDAKTALERRTILEGEGYTLLLIDALAPVQDCIQLVKERT